MRIKNPFRQARESVSLEALCYQEFGVQFHNNMALCFAHDDTRPSLRLVGDRVQCWACGWWGDAVDVVKFSRKVTGDEALRLIGEMSLPAPTASQTPAKLSPSIIQSIIDVSHQRRVEYFHILEKFVTSKELPCSAEWLADEWDVGVESAIGTGIISVPHYDPDKQPTGLKTRTPGRAFRAVTGSRFPWLYGVWRRRSASRVLVVEGESDAWTASYDLRDHDIDVLSVPTGAGALVRAEWAQMVEQYPNRYIIFDSDQAGLAGVARWHQMITIEHRMLPQDQDISSLDPIVREKIFDSII